MLQPHPPCCHSSLAPLPPRRSRETRLCVWCSSEATRLKTEWGCKIRPDRQIQSKASTQGPVAPVWLMSQSHSYMSRLFALTDNKRASLFTMGFYIQRSTWRHLFFCVAFWNLEVVLMWLSPQGLSCGSNVIGTSRHVVALCCGQFISLTSFASLAFLTWLHRDLCCLLLNQQGAQIETRTLKEVCNSTGPCTL